VQPEETSIDDDEDHDANDVENVHVWLQLRQVALTKKDRVPKVNVKA
jgi:hypothetical protein